jgi:bacteriocin-like protein
MSKTNDTSCRELTSNELAAVSGGADVHIERLQTTVTTASSDGLLDSSTLNAVVKSILGLLR